MITTCKVTDYKTPQDKTSLFTALPMCVTLCPLAHAVFQLTFQSSCSHFSFAIQALILSLLSSLWNTQDPIKVNRHVSLISRKDEWQ